MLGQALVATRDKARVDEAVTILQTALTREPEAPDAYSQLAMAYGQKNDLAHADLASAQAAFMRGDMKTAREIASRAKTRFPVGSLAGSRPTTSPATSRRRLPRSAVDDRRTRTMKLTRAHSRRAARARAGSAGGGTARAQTFTGDQRGEIERIIKEYLLSHPELLQEVMAELEKRQATAEAEKNRAAVTQHSASIFTSPRQVTLGNAQGDVTVVEFFDYNCGYCKRAMADMLDLRRTTARSSSCSRVPRAGRGLRRRRKSRRPCAQDKTGGKKFRSSTEAVERRGPADKARAARRRQGGRPRRGADRKGHRR